METSSVFVTYFVIGFIASSFTIGVIMLIKKVFKNQLSAKWQYNLWYLLLIALTLPFVSTHLSSFENPFHLLEVKHSHQTGAPTNATGDHMIQSASWLRDFTISVNRSTPDILNVVIGGIWIAGVFVLTLLSIRGWLKIKDIKNNTFVLKNREILLLFEQCKQHLNISRHIHVRESPLVNSPMTFGLFKPYIVLPMGFEDWLSMKDIQYIFLHELNHYKNRDIWTNYLMIIFQILYWFNPLVWIAFREMRLDREIACDIAVLNLLDEHCYSEYGDTIINFVDRVSQPRNFILANQINDSKKQIKRRIEKIASFTTESKLLKLKSIAIFILAGLFVTSQVPFISAMAEDNTRYDFKNEQSDYENLSKYFAGFEGSFVLYDMGSDQYHIYNENKSILRVSPNSTYKIFSALIALESNVITGNNSTMKWNGIQYPYDDWNMDQNLFTAMKSSVNWYFENLDQKIQRDDLQAFLQKIGYGNTDLSGGIGQYWIESSLKISPVEQVRLLRAFYTNQFGFKEENVRTVKEAIRLEEQAGIQLSGKTGTGAVNNKNINGWFIGYVETKENTYFFATNIQSDDNANGSTAAEITLSILKDKGIY